MSYPIGLQVLRAKIRGFQSSGSTISSRITRSEKERKNRLWNQKRALGVHCRAHLVAYGLLRGVPYDQIERCAPNNKLNPQVVLDIMLAHNRWTPKRGLVKYDLATVEKLLTLASSPTSPEACLSSPPAPSPEPTAPPTSSLLERARGLLRKIG